jgi:hypothetical protein
MKALKILQLSASVVLLALAISCSDQSEEIVEVSPYSWKESELSPDGLFNYAWLGSDDDGNLYAYGTSPNRSTAFFKLTGGSWTNVGEPNVDEARTFQSYRIYHGSIFYHGAGKLYKIEGTENKEILSGAVIASIEVCKDELVVNGSISVSNDVFTIVSYDGTNIKPLSKEMTASRIVSANDKVYIPGFPAVSYDGHSLSLLNYYGFFVAVDREEQFYFRSAPIDNKFHLSRRSNFGQEEKLGNPIVGMDEIFRDIEFFDGTTFTIGTDTMRGYSKVYFLKDDKWIEVPTEHVIYDVIVYDNRLIASSLDGKIYELVKD